MPHTLLKKIIDTIKDSYDIIILDLASTSGISIEQALFASDKVILATDCDEFLKEGIDSCFISKFNKNAKIHLTIKNSLIEKFEERGFDKENFFTILY